MIKYGIVTEKIRETNTSNCKKKLVWVCKKDKKEFWRDKALENVLVLQKRKEVQMHNFVEYFDS